MKNDFFLFKSLQNVLGIVLLISTTFSAVASAACLQSFNGYGTAYAPKVSTRTSLFMEEIKSEGCEVVQLQEIWTSSQTSLIDSFLDSSTISFKPNLQSRNGLMSFTKWNLYQAQYYKFQYNSDGGFLDGGRDMLAVEKGFAVMNVSTPADPILFINLHLHPASRAVRLAQIFELIQWRLQLPEHAPLFLSGDFNMDVNSLERRLLMQALRLQDTMEVLNGHYPDKFCTYCANNRLGWLSKDKVFDYAFISTHAPIQVTDFRINLKGTSELPHSDHYGINIQFNFVKKAIPPRELPQETQYLVGLLNKSLPVVNQKYTKSSKVYSNLRLWLRQLQRRDGEFWDYYSKLP